MEHRALDDDLVPISCEILQIKISPQHNSFSIKCLHSLIIMLDDDQLLGEDDNHFIVVGHKALLTIQSHENQDVDRILVWDLNNRLLSSEVLLDDPVKVCSTVHHTVVETWLFNVISYQIFTDVNCEHLFYVDIDAHVHYLPIPSNLHSYSPIPPRPTSPRSVRESSGIRIPPIPPPGDEVKKPFAAFSPASAPQDIVQHNDSVHGDFLLSSHTLFTRHHSNQQSKLQMVFYRRDRIWGYDTARRGHGPPQRITKSISLVEYHFTFNQDDLVSSSLVGQRRLVLARPPSRSWKGYDHNPMCRDQLNLTLKEEVTDGLSPPTTGSRELSPNILWVDEMSKVPYISIFPPLSLSDQAVPGTSTLGFGIAPFMPGKRFDDPAWGNGWHSSVMCGNSGRVVTLWKSRSDYVSYMFLYDVA